tara:strand:+ start:720 stop:2972 length:2253 start_codon:yes stop_codon:yes gene_type:complete
MFTTSTLIENLPVDNPIKFENLCKNLKITKKKDKENLTIAIKALSKVGLFKETEDKTYIKIEDNNIIYATIRCSSKGYSFAVREDGLEDIYIKEHYLNNAIHGDKVIIKILKEGQKKRSPEGIVCCITKRAYKTILAKVDKCDDDLFAIPVDDRILSKVKLSKKDSKFSFSEKKNNIVEVKIDKYSFAQYEAEGHVIREYLLDGNKDIDNELVLSKMNIDKNDPLSKINIKECDTKDRLDLTKLNSYIFTSWESIDAPVMPAFSLEVKKDLTRIWIHSNNVGEFIDMNNSTEDFFRTREATTFSNSGWINILNKQITDICKFIINKPNNAISLLIELDQKYSVKNWSFKLTKIKPTLTINYDIIKQIENIKPKSRNTPNNLKKIKDHILVIQKFIEISKSIRAIQLQSGDIEIDLNSYSFLENNDLIKQIPGQYINGYLSPISTKDPNSIISPLISLADSIWYYHSHKLNVKSLFTQKSNIDENSINEILRASLSLDNTLSLNDKGTIPIQEISKASKENEINSRIINKLIKSSIRPTMITSNLFNDDKSNIKQDSNNSFEINSEKSPWVLPSLDLVNIINQFLITELIVNGKLSNTNNQKGSDDLGSKDIWQKINSNVFTKNQEKSLYKLFNHFNLELINDSRLKLKKYLEELRSMILSRKAEKIIGKEITAIITGVQSYGLFTEIDEFRAEGLIHISTLDDDWYEYRSRQNLLVGRKSKRIFKIGDPINIRVIKVDILKNQIDLELTK